MKKNEQKKIWVKTSLDIQIRNVYAEQRGPSSGVFSASYAGFTVSCWVLQKNME